MTLHGIYCKDVPLGDKETKVQTGQVTCPGPHPKMRARIQVSPFPTAWTLGHSSTMARSMRFGARPSVFKSRICQVWGVWFEDFFKGKKIIYFYFLATPHGLCCLVTKSCPTFCDLMDYSSPGSSVLGISQVRILEWVAISLSGGSSWPRDWTWVSCISRQILYHWAAREGPPHGLWDLNSPQGSNMCPLQWKHRVLTTGLPGNSFEDFFFASLYLNFHVLLMWWLKDLVFAKGLKQFGGI